MFKQHKLIFFIHHKPIGFFFLIPTVFPKPEWLTADAAEKPAVLLYFLSFWCLDEADNIPIFHLRQPVPPWFPQWHAVLSLTGCIIQSGLY